MVYRLCSSRNLGSVVDSTCQVGDPEKSEPNGFRETFMTPRITNLSLYDDPQLS